MNVDKTKSEWREVPSATQEFDKEEMRKSRILMRRAQYLEQQVRENGGIATGGNGGGAWAELESDALFWVLSEIGFAEEKPK